jgi:uncharacterized membrane protein YhhN
VQPQRILMMASVVAGLSYFLTIPWHPFPGTIALKGCSVSALAAFGWTSLQGNTLPRNRLLLTAALALSSLGDILLDLSESMFVLGLGSFLAAHVCYIQLFLAQRKKNESLGLTRLLLTGLLVSFTGVFTMWLLPGLGGMAAPVMAYVGVLAGMVFASLTWRASTPVISAGAFLFLISDAVLGASKFREAVPLRGWIVWGTYYAAQYLIATGTVNELLAAGRQAIQRSSGQSQIPSRVL